MPRRRSKVPNGQIGMQRRQAQPPAEHADLGQGGVQLPAAAGDVQGEHPADASWRTRHYTWLEMAARLHNGVTREQASTELTQLYRHANASEPNVDPKASIGVSSLIVARDALIDFLLNVREREC